MANRAEQRKVELTEQVVGRVRDKLSRDKAAQAERFVRQFYANVAPDDLTRASIDELYGAALAMWQYGAVRKPGTPAVRVCNPRVEQDGWHASHTIVQIVNDDMPFLVDSVSAELHRHGLNIHLIIHPVLKVKRTPDGKLAEIYEPQAAPADAATESYMHFEVDQQSDPAQLDQLRDDILRVLGDVRAAVTDFKQMRQRVAETLKDSAERAKPVSEDELAEGLAFLKWMDEDNFIFLGIREYRFGKDGEEVTLDVEKGQGLGILRDDQVSVLEGLRNYTQLPPDVRTFLHQPRLLMVAKANRNSTVHRPASLDIVMVKIFDKKGVEIGERLFSGLFTSAAYNRSARDIPYLRKKVQRTVQRAGFDKGGHDGKALIQILETYPRDELFQVSDDELFDIALGILHLQDRQRVALFVRRDPFERFVSALVYVPRDRYDTDLRLRIQAILEKAFSGKTGHFNVALTESALARVHFQIDTAAGKIPDYDTAAIEAQIIEAARGWVDRLQQALTAAKGEGIGLSLARRYGVGLPATYRETYGPDAAVVDIDRFEQAAETGRIALNLHRPVEASANELYFKLYQDKRPVELSDVLPMLEDMGLRVLTAGGPYEVRLPDRPHSIFLQDFQMETVSGQQIELDRVKALFEEAFIQVWTGEAQTDGFNKLVLGAGLRSREVAVLRAYAKYLRQAKFDFTQAYLEDTLATHPEITRQLIVLFRCLHDPEQLKKDGREGVDRRAAETIKQIDLALDRVTNLDEDRILRRFLNLVRSTLRTNYFQKATGGGVKSYISFKLDSRAIDDLPLPRPLVEIWVYSPRVEAVHLRGGKVARGGIRWSDRKEDFRTEILGLMKAQMVKNAVIVPVGSKGGFVVKNPPPAAAGRDALMAEVIECYKTMMRGLLDITDNLVAGKIVPPADVVRLDEDDPYLVVAADKGTATFSDIANGVSQEYGFWLDDAFASGGSAGYDHKKMGITARGAWESVKRHFRELGRDIQNQDFSVIGVGDMSGDVFGNGMLLSKHIRLRAAFDHRHIFLDPSPDVAKSWAERKRMFDLPRSSWADYDKNLISAGGGVFERSLKSIPLTDEVKAAFGIDPSVAQMTPVELMRRLLASETDLLWFGGIGTYVKSSGETHAEVGDKANDGLRVDARDLKALVIGEGANLGFTQRGRVEAALNGRRINTDAIDNSAGVDTSDHEVNIKILLRDVMDRGQLTRTQRDQLLAQMTDEVGKLVLADNYKQTQALTVAEAVAPEALEDQVRVMRQMEKAGRLNRAIEFLPDDEQAAERAQAGRGLTRPELAVLLAYSKLVLYDKLLASELPDEPKMVEDLIRYFPQPLKEKFAEAIGNHRLRREIIATVATNGMVNRVGPAFVTEMVEQTGMGEGDVARSYIAVREAFALRSQWEGIEALDNKVPAKIQAAMVLETNKLMRRTIPWLLVRGKFPLDVAAEAARLAPAVEALAGALEKVLPEATLAELVRRTEALTADGVPTKLARRIASLPVLAAVTDIAHIAAETKAKVEPVAAVYFAVEDGLGFGWLRARAQAHRSDNHWQRQAAAALIEDLFALQGRLAERVMAGCESGVKDAATAAACVATWAGNRPGPVERVQGLLAELRAVASVDLSMLSVAARQLRGLVAG